MKNRIQNWTYNVLHMQGKGNTQHCKQPSKSMDLDVVVLDSDRIGYGFRMMGEEKWKCEQGKTNCNYNQCSDFFYF